MAVKFSPQINKYFIYNIYIYISNSNKIGIIYSKDSKSNYDQLKQITTYLPINLLPEEFGDSITEELPTLINKLESSVSELYNKGVRRFLLGGPSSVFVPWILGKYLTTNENIFCDKKERWVDCKFFFPNNSLAYKGNTLNIFLIARNIYRFIDLTSGGDVPDIIDALKTQVFVDIPLPKVVFEIIQVGDNASENSIKNLDLAFKGLDIVPVKIPVKIISDPDPIKQEKFGGLAVFIDGSEKILNDWIKILNTSNESVGLSIAVNGGLADSFTNTILNTNLDLLNVTTGEPVNATLYQIFEDITKPTSIFGGDPSVLSTRDKRNKNLGTNYTYYKLVSGQEIPPLPVDQYNNIYNAIDIFNPILTKVNGNLPGDTDPVLLANIESIEYILAEYKGELDIFNGAQDNRFRFDLLTQRSRISALVEYSYYPANSFDKISSGLRLNKNLIP